MKKERLLKIAEIISAKPQLLDMSNFGSHRTLERLRNDECRTSCCIAGWAQVLYGEEDGISDSEFTVESERSGETLLGLDAFSQQYTHLPVKPRGVLFFKSHWRPEFYTCDEYGENFGEIVALRIKFFVATGGSDHEADFDASAINNEFQSAWEIFDKVQELTNE